MRARRRRTRCAGRPSPHTPRHPLPSSPIVLDPLVRERIKSSVIKGEPCRTVKKHLSTPTKVAGQRCRTGVLRVQEALTDPGRTWNVRCDPARGPACRLCSSTPARGRPVTLSLIPGQQSTGSSLCGDQGGSDERGGGAATRTAAPLALNLPLCTHTRGPACPARRQGAWRSSGSRA